MLDELQAAFALVKMQNIEKWTERYISIAKIYSEGISNKVIKPNTTYGYRDVFHNYIIVVQSEFRDELMKKLLELGVDTKVHYPIPLHLQPCSAELGYKIGDLPNAERLSKSMISLPIYPLLNENEINHVIQSLNKLVDQLW